ncbi:heterodisulfide reductase-related iron-sulfur binding cluster [Sphingosinicella microcystinivorans]|uniref:heterodisulfide reductase-related iron-sulfur binding cluster n=1 Tax=Sphingosinicella microcystinivorans TaxID=335406 RepID=UPI0022F3EBA9|nr:heterodisulfide reductase-related iron-sulfur binding cluster [Sphingosinicella microcystinivorans]WBX84342.1 heterodisulfide reductase-related iron-sulfur binding cluster [Sphingosinicella microcystinivorans]
MREGSLEAPTRHPIDWENPDYYDEAKLEAELTRVFDICHGCRRCFNLCDSFPILFDLIDESESGEIDGLDPKTDYRKVVDACTLCDMCFMTKCPYVPPHEWALDVPHLMLRARAVEHRKGETRFADTELAKTDRNGKLASFLSPLANWATDTGNGLTRTLMEKTIGVNREAWLPPFADTPLDRRGDLDRIDVDAAAPAAGRKVALYATCFSNWNMPGPGEAAVKVLKANGVDTRIVYPGCCGMPKLENGDLAAVAEQAHTVAAAFAPLIDDGFDVVAVTPSCALMLKFEWPLILPDDPLVKKLAEATFDITEYVVDIAKKEGLAPGMQPLGGDVAIHLPCHSRAQNMGQKGAEMLRLIPEAKVGVVERCSGHGGKWGIFRENFATALKVGKPAGRAMLKTNAAFMVSECPLAGPHLRQVMEREGGERIPEQVPHPIELLAKAYGL